MASRTLDEFENDWTFVDKDGKVDVEPRKDSVSYSKSPTTRDEAVVSPSDLPAKDDSEGEAEFEVLSGFQCHPALEAESNQAADTAQVENDLPHSLESVETEDEFVAVHPSSCQCAADDGIMIISNHFCVDHDAASVDDDVLTTDQPLASECDLRNQESQLSSTNLSDSTADGWQELPQLSESGSFTFGTDSNSSEEDNAIEPIPEEEEHQDYVDLSHETAPLKEMAESTCSVFSFDSDLFSPSDVDEDADNEDDHNSDITQVSEVSDEDKERDHDEEEVEDHLMAEGNDDHTSAFFYVDIPTLFVVLGVTTALGFSIGYGLSVYISNQALEVSGSIKRPGPKTASLPLSSDAMEPLDDISRDFLDQLTMWKLEDRLEAPREQEPETEMEDLFDTKALHEKLQLKHFKLMGLHESAKQRLRMTKVMSWYWRLKYEEERSNKEGKEWTKALQEQLQDTEKLYLQEKQIADLWRRMNENKKLRRAVAGGIKSDKYWKVFLNRWKKGEDRSPGVNNSQKVSDSTKLCEKPEVEELVETTAAKDPEPNEQKRKREHMRDRMRDIVDFRNRWTKDSQLKARTEKSCSKSGQCGAYGNTHEREDLTLVFRQHSVATILALSPWFPDARSLRIVLKSLEDPEALSRNPERGEAKKSIGEVSGESDNSDNNPEQISKMKHTDFKEAVPPFENPLFPNGISFSGSGIPNYLLKRDSKVAANPLAPTVSSKQRYLRVISFPDGTSDARWIYEDGTVVKEPIPPQNAKKMKTREKSFPKAGCQPISYEALAKRKCEEEGVVWYETERKSKTSKKQDVAMDGNQTVIPSQGQCLTKEKQKLRNLSQLRGEEIRKQRIQRREMKKKEREAERFLSELRRERRLTQIEKRKLRRSWKALKREKKRISLERELHKKDRKELKNFMTTLKEEKQKLKRNKIKLKEKVNEERGNLKLKEKALDAEKKKEVERLRNEISQEKNKLKQKKEELKSLRKAAKMEYKKWLRELRKIKRQEEERREAEQAKLREKARKKRQNAERERRRKREIDSVIREQAKFDKEKRRKTEKERGEHTTTRDEWKETNSNMKQDEFLHQRDSEKKAKQNDRKESFRTQLGDVRKWLSDVYKKTLKQKQNDPEESFRNELEDVKKWFSDVYKKTLEKQQILWPGNWIKPTLDVNNGGAGNSEPHDEKPADVEGTGELKRRDTNSAIEKERKANDGDDTPGRNECQNGRAEIRKMMSRKEKRGCELAENRKWEIIVSKTEMTKISEDKALTDFTNLTYDADLVKMLLRFEMQKHGDKTTSDSGGATESTAFVIVSEEAIDRDSHKKQQPPDRKPKHPDDRRQRHQKWQEKNPDPTKRRIKSPRGPIASADSRMASEDLYQQATAAQNVRYKLSPEGPTPPKGIGLSLDEWYEKRFNMRKNKRKQVTPQGPILSDDMFQVQFRKGKKRKRRQTSDIHGKVCTSDNPETGESIPPPDWIFERAKGRTHQRSSPWYVRRAEDREFHRNTDKHNSQIPCGRKRKRYKGPFDRNSWFFGRADDRAFQRVNNVPWYTRRVDGREAEREKGHDSWFLERGYYRRDFREFSSRYGGQNWMPQGPTMEEHR